MRSSKSRFVLATLVVLLASGSLFARKDPDWILGNSAKYPEPQFFIGVGSVSSAKGGEKQQHQWAGDQARGEIAKILKTEVSVTT
ncbi:MAG: hypothetical protein HYY44_00650, partial [Deltaproteobacteria bacterium]|nr:hypothetical protein [Deltaproteobacteria bacterium]